MANAETDIAACDRLTEESFLTQVRTLELGKALAGGDPDALFLLAGHLEYQWMIHKGLIARGSGGAVQ